MDLKRFGCHVDPFAEAPDRRMFYFDALRRRIQEEIISSIGRTNGFILLTGEPGVGKTAMLQCLTEAIELRPDCYILSSPPWLTCRPATTLRELAEAFSYARCLARLRDREMEARFAAAMAAGDRAIFSHGPRGERIAAVILDDADRLAPQVVVQLRRLRTAFQSVRGPLSIIMTTCSEEGAADAGAIEMSSENARSGDVLIRLRPFKRRDVQPLIDHRLRAAGSLGALLVPPEAVTGIYAHAKGNPSKTTRICRRALALASEDCSSVSTAVVDAAAEIEFGMQPALVVDAPFLQASTASPAKPSGLPPAPAISEAGFAGPDPSGRSNAFGESRALRARPLRLASAAASVATVLAVGWFYVAGWDGRMDAIPALETAMPSGVSAAVALVQPDGERRAPNTPGEAVLPPELALPPEPVLPVEAALAVEFSHPADTESALSARDHGESLRPRPAAAADTAPMAANAEPLNPEAESAPLAPHSESLARDLLDSQAIESGPAVPGQDASSGFTGPDVNELLARGNSLMELGDVAAARLFYTMASQRGSVEGAMLMGLTFDPEYFERKGIYGTRPDVFEAMEWYRKAASMGDAVAQEHISALELRLRRAVQEGDEEARHALKLLSPQPR